MVHEQLGCGHGLPGILACLKVRHDLINQCLWFGVYQQLIIILYVLFLVGFMEVDCLSSSSFLGTGSVTLLLYGHLRKHPVPENG